MKDISEMEYRTPLTPDSFAKRFRYSSGLVRLAIDCGLESSQGKITAIDFCNWFAAHYNDIRKLAGLPLLETPTDGMSADERATLTIGSVLRTHADYFASRCSSLALKEAWRNLSIEFAQCRKRHE